jgi:hypothetical protein
VLRGPIALAAKAQRAFSGLLGKSAAAGLQPDFGLPQGLSTLAQGLSAGGQRVVIDRGQPRLGGGAAEDLAGRHKTRTGSGAVFSAQRCIQRGRTIARPERQQQGAGQHQVAQKRCMVFGHGKAVPQSPKLGKGGDDFAVGWGGLLL